MEEVLREAELLSRSGKLQPLDPKNGLNTLKVTELITVLQLGIELNEARRQRGEGVVKKVEFLCARLFEIARSYFNTAVPEWLIEASCNVTIETYPTGPEKYHRFKNGVFAKGRGLMWLCQRFNTYYKI